MSAREKRAKAREEKSKSNVVATKGSSSSSSSKGKSTPRDEVEEEEEEEVEQLGPLCIVYHSWEHYSSLRNLKGPHTGPPRLRIVSFHP
jgi:hypothetical protein